MWRLDADVKLSNEAITAHTRSRAIRKLARTVAARAANTVDVTHDDSLLFVYAANKDDLARSRIALEGALQATGASASIHTAAWDQRHKRWRRPDGSTSHVQSHLPARAVKPTDIRLTLRRPLQIAAGIALVLAPLGAIWYAASPGAITYQAFTVLTLPAVLISVFWIGRRLPRRWRWVLALLLAPIGPVGYVVLGGSQWWAWGQLSVVPLVILVISESVRSGTGRPIAQRWPIEPGAGPYGPP